jgi:hypothetical protein
MTADGIHKEMWRKDRNWNNGKVIKTRAFDGIFNA